MIYGSLISRQRKVEMNAPNTDILKQQFIDGMSHAACTVSVITTDGAAGKSGVTVSAMSSVSADTPKPTLLVCVHRLSPAAQCILDNGVFCVNVLRSDQSYISDTFAGRFKDQFPDKFSCAKWTTQKTGAPRVIDPLVSFDCSVVSSNEVGTHYVFFGEVEDVFVADIGSPLVYANRAYGATTRFESSASPVQGGEGSDSRLTIGFVQTFGPYFLPGLIAEYQMQSSDIHLQFVEGNQRKVQESLLAGEVDIAFLYDLDLSSDIEKEQLTTLEPYVLVPENHYLTDKSEIFPEDLEGLPMVLLDVPPSGEYFLQMLRDEGVNPDVQFRSGSFEMVRGMVGHGFGYTILATKPASAMTYDGYALESRPFRTKTASSSVVMATRIGVAKSSQCDDFSRLCRASFRGSFESS